MPKDPKEIVRIELTEEQRKSLRDQTGQDADVLEFNVEELEERILPSHYMIAN